MARTRGPRQRCSRTCAAENVGGTISRRGDRRSPLRVSSAQSRASTRRVPATQETCGRNTGVGAGFKPARVRIASEADKRSWPALRRLTLPSASDDSRRGDRRSPLHVSSGQSRARTRRVPATREACRRNTGVGAGFKPARVRIASQADKRSWPALRLTLPSAGRSPVGATGGRPYMSHPGNPGPAPAAFQPPGRRAAGTQV